MPESVPELYAWNFCTQIFCKIDKRTRRFCKKKFKTPPRFWNKKRRVAGTCRQLCIVWHASSSQKICSKTWTFSWLWTTDKISLDSADQAKTGAVTDIKESGQDSRLASGIWLRKIVLISGEFAEVSFPYRKSWFYKQTFFKFLNSTKGPSS